MDVQALGALPLRVRLGFINALVDMLRHLGHRLTPFQPEICALLVSLLESAPLVLVRICSSHQQWETSEALLRFQRF